MRKQQFKVGQRVVYHRPKGVMILGRKMPRTCKDCPCSQVTFYVDVYKDINETHFFCKNTYKRAYKTRRPSWCPLQEGKANVCVINMTKNKY